MTPFRFVRAAQAENAVQEALTDEHSAFADSVPVAPK